MKSQSIIQVDADIDLSYFKNMLSDVKRKVEDQNFIQERAMHSQSEVNIECILITFILLDELELAYDEIKNNDKDLR